MKTRSISQGKTFLVVGATFSAIECTLEKVRGKKDLKNAIVAGFSTGALLAARAGQVDHGLKHAHLWGGVGGAGWRRGGRASKQRHSALDAGRSQPY